MLSAAVAVSRVVDGVKALFANTVSGARARVVAAIGVTDGTVLKGESNACAGKRRACRDDDRPLDRPQDLPSGGPQHPLRAQRGDSRGRRRDFEMLVALETGEQHLDDFVRG